MGYMFNIDDSRICWIIQHLEPGLARVMAISKNKIINRAFALGKIVLFVKNFRAA